MSQTSTSGPRPGEQTVREIRWATRRQHSAEEKIRIVLDGVRGESSIAAACRRQGNGVSFGVREFGQFGAQTLVNQQLHPTLLRRGALRSATMAAPLGSSALALGRPRVGFASA